jgi:ABC-type glutathione transport system ATPase component
MVVNAAGPWAGKLAALAGVSLPLQPGPGVMVAVEGRVTNMVINRLHPAGEGDIIIPQRRLSLLGTIRFKGKGIVQMDKAENRDYRRKVQLIFQDPYESLNPRFTVFDTVAEPLRALNIGTREDPRRMVMQTLQLAGLKPDEYLDRYPHQMSGGQRQSVGIASALVLEPELVIADEPVSMLDVSIRASILDLIRSLSERMNFTCIWVSHDLSILSNVSERLMIMYLGRTMELAPTREVITDPLHP